MEIQVTLKGNFDKELASFVQGLGQDVYSTIKANTPIKSGNARRNWTLNVTKNSAVIDNKVPYIERLEAGASRQAPRGMIGPTLTTIKGKYK